MASEWSVVGSKGKKKQQQPKKQTEEQQKNQGADQRRKDPKAPSEPKEKEQETVKEAKHCVANGSGAQHEPDTSAAIRGGSPVQNGDRSPKGGKNKQKQEGLNGCAKEKETKEKKENKAKEEKPAFRFVVEPKATGYTLRGLVNSRNNCYQNALLHALMACPPFLNMVKGLPIRVLSRAPVLKALREVFFEFRTAGSAVSGRSLLDAMARRFPAAAKGQQADAGEYLLALLKAITEEFSHVFDLCAAGPEPEADDGGGWETAGRRGRKSRGVEHTTGVGEAGPVGDIFGGIISSRLASRNAKPSVTLEPFTVLPLDVIHSAPSPSRSASIQQLVGEWAAPQEVELIGKGWGSKQMSFSSMPPVLVLCLKLWCDASQKAQVSRSIRIDPVLTVHPSATTLQQRVQYNLCGTVCHKGPEMTSGHYTAVVRKNGKWALLDDDSPIRQLPDASAASAAAEPYLLFYCKA